MATYPEHCFTNRSKLISVLAAQDSEGKGYLLVERRNDETYLPPRDLCVYPVIEGAVEDGILVIDAGRKPMTYVNKTGISHAGPYGDIQEGGLGHEVLQDMAQQDANQLEAATPAPLTPETVRLIIGQIDPGEPTFS
ncbi:MAG: hypothetical protein WD603_02245 [Patescibacteria group bacterium]